MNYERNKQFLIDAIKGFITQNEVLDDNTLRNAANDYVYEHDEEIREHLRDEIDFESIFEDALANIDWDDIW